MTDSQPARPQRFFLRFDRHQRAQHIMILIAFTVLVATGLPIRYAGSPAAWVITQAVGGASIAAMIHRAAAILLLAGSAYHIVYLAVLVIRGSRTSRMFPELKDVKDAIVSVFYNLGIVRHEPRYDRYSFAEKFEYWSMVWGTFTMAATGALLWNPVLSARFVPMVVLKLARVIHSYEALLAFLAITIWHFYHVHLNPEMFPMSKLWITGLISEEEMKRHHPVEYERIMALQHKAEPPGEKDAASDT